MRTPLLYFSFLLIFFSVPAAGYALSTPEPANRMDVQTLYRKIASMKMKDFKKLRGGKLTLKEKIGFLVMKQKAKRALREKSEGQAAFVMGLVALGLLALGFFVPYVIIGSLVASILAIVMGSMALKSNPDDRKARGGRMMGWITLGLIALLMIAAAIIIAGWSWY
ncbi:MAG: hypothetical protein IAE96_01155 [Chitinophagaceae bacterium]|nr:hypothetical protein [Chitinophagaceae bacterium]